MAGQLVREAFDQGFVAGTSSPTVVRAVDRVASARMLDYKFIQTLVRHRSKATAELVEMRRHHLCEDPRLSSARSTSTIFGAHNQELHLSHISMIRIRVSGTCANAVDYIATKLFTRRTGPSGQVKSFVPSDSREFPNFCKFMSRINRPIPKMVDRKMRRNSVFEKRVYSEMNAPIVIPVELRIIFIVFEPATHVC